MISTRHYDFIEPLVARRWFRDRMNTHEISRELRVPEWYVDRAVARIVESRFRRLTERKETAHG